MKDTNKQNTQYTIHIYQQFRTTLNLKCTYKKVGKWIPLCFTAGVKWGTNGYVKFEFNDKSLHTNENPP